MHNIEQLLMVHTYTPKEIKAELLNHKVLIYFDEHDNT